MCENSPANTRFFLLSDKAQKTKKNDYKDMRIIDDETYAQIVKLLAQDSKVALFQKLLLSEKVDQEPAEKPAEKKKPEVK